MSPICGEGGIRPLGLRRSRLRPPGASPAFRAPQGRAFPSAAGSGSNPGISVVKHSGGEGGIRTLGTVLPVQPLSRRLPSAGSATSPIHRGHSCLISGMRERNVPAHPGGGSRIRPIRLRRSRLRPPGRLDRLSRSASHRGHSCLISGMRERSVPAHSAVSGSNPGTSVVKHPGGGSRIRTHGAFPLSGFQDRRLQPLGHPSLNLLSIPDRICHGQWNIPRTRRPPWGLNSRINSA